MVRLINYTAMELDYKNAIIYKLVNTVDNKIYVGSTRNTKEVRKIMHKAKAAKYPHRRVYAHLNQFDWDKEVDIIVIENFPCNSEEELKVRERYWYDRINPELNTYRPTRTEEEIKERKKENNKKYRKENKEKILKYREEEFICPCGGKYTRNHFSRHSKALIHQKWVNQQEEDCSAVANTKHIEYPKKEKFNCPCGGKYTSNHFSRHNKTLIHQKWVKVNQQEEDCSAVANTRHIEYPDEEVSEVDESADHTE